MSGNVAYAGDVDCKEAWDSLTNTPKAALIDVRTTREWEVIGIPDISATGKPALFIEWQMFPTMELNTRFADEADRKLSEAGISKDDPVFMLCRSGARSQGAAAALTALGYARAYNVAGGFEGMPDQTGARGKVEGWIFDGLPTRGLAEPRDDGSG